MTASVKEVKESMKFMKKELKSLARAEYIFKNVVLPRAEADGRIIRELSGQIMKLEGMLQKLESGEEVTDEERRAAIPEQFT